MARIKTTLDRQVVRPCTACRDITVLELHHIVTKGARPDLRESNFNLMPLCHPCHQKAHMVGLNRFYNANVNCINFLDSHGWEFDEYSQKWLPPQDE